jgi:hypothetical protein
VLALQAGLILEVVVVLGAGGGAGVGALLLNGGGVLDLRLCLLFSLLLRLLVVWLLLHG